MHKNLPNWTGKAWRCPLFLARSTSATLSRLFLLRVVTSSTCRKTSGSQHLLSSHLPGSPARTYMITPHRLSQKFDSQQCVAIIFVTSKIWRSKLLQQYCRHWYILGGPQYTTPATLTSLADVSEKLAKDRQIWYHINCNILYISAENYTNIWFKSMLHYWYFVDAYWYDAITDSKHYHSFRWHTVNGQESYCHQRANASTTRGPCPMPITHCQEHPGIPAKSARHFHWAILREYKWLIKVWNFT